MKKLITLMIATISMIALHAQTSKEEARKVVLGGSKNGGTSSKKGRDVVLGGDNGNRTYPNPNNDPSGSRQADVDQVNREYDMKINSIRNNGYLSQSEKERMIAQLEKDRSKRLREINSRYYKKNKNYGQKDDHDGDSDGDDDDDRKEKNNNGKHKGWEKGKGNKGKNKHD